MPNKDQTQQPKTAQEIADIVELCSFEAYSLVVIEDGTGAIYMQGQYVEPDIVTGEDTMQYTRKWLISRYATKSEIVQTCFKLCMTSYEHRAREHFQYKGKRIFGPHYDVDALHGIANQLDYRE